MGIMTDGKEAVKEAKEFLRKAKPDLTISDVPSKTLELFKQFANDEFSSSKSKGHYGFCLKFLLDFYLGRIAHGSEVAEAKADEALIQLSELKQPDEKKPIRLVNGKELRC